MDGTLLGMRPNRNGWNTVGLAEGWRPDHEPVKPVKRGTRSEAKSQNLKKKWKPKSPRQISPWNVVETIVKAAGCTIFVTRVKGFHTIKLSMGICA